MLSVARRCDCRYTWIRQPASSFEVDTHRAVVAVGAATLYSAKPLLTCCPRIKRLPCCSCRESPTRLVPVQRRHLRSQRLAAVVYDVVSARYAAEATRSSRQTSVHGQIALYGRVLPSNEDLPAVHEGSTSDLRSLTVDRIRMRP